ncbi:g- coupled receptor [Trichoderma arundinaceum]|uniref:G-coupled receptor n=1 Tax=Trichoderma arundinaceum TaxID=490622 RepID=A0A395NER9_TRIAR|nr:g- coupled receptor [Trichoderma arundinaceum]
MAGLTEAQFDALVIVERVCSSVSMIASSFIILTFCCSKYFSKSINRLIFYASFGNLLANIGHMMSRDFIHQPTSAGCLTQAFMMQTFIPADVLWTLAMAINVYLTFYHKFEVRDLRKIEPIYLICCYGIPLIPGFTYLFIKDSDGIRIYGPATSWCWIRSEWDILRLATFYAPMWFCILLIFAIYIRAGRTIYKVRKQVYLFQSSDLDPISADDAMTSIPSTDVTLTMEAMSDRDPSKLSHNASQPSYRAGSGSEAARRPSPAHIATNQSNLSNQSDGTQSTYYCASPPHRGSNPQRSNAPQSIAARAFRSIRRRNHERDNAAWSYTKCALLFFTAMLITWIPSSANRLYSLTHNDSISVPLEFMSVFVIPLQGFWNCVVYVVTSWVACKNLFHDMWLAVRSAFITRMDRIRGRTPNEGTPNEGTPNEESRDG